MKPTRILAHSIASLFLASSSALAVENFWTGAIDNDWNKPGNWSLNRVPTNTNGAPTGDTFDDAVVNTLTNFPVITANLAATPRDILAGSGAGTVGRIDHRSGTAATGGGNWMMIGRDGGAGTYNLANTATTGGTLTGFGLGSGNVTVGGRLYVGGVNFGAAATGTYNVNTSGTLAIGNDLAVGSAGGTGVMNVDAGTITTGGWNFIGKNEGATGANGTLKMNGGTLTNTGRTYVGQSNATGRLELTGNAFYNNINNELFIIGEGAGSNGTVIVNSPTAQLNVGGELWVGQDPGGNGTMTVSAGSVLVGNWLAVGRAGATGVLTINGTGLVRKTDTDGFLEIGNNAASNGTVNLDGGTLAVNGIRTGNGATSTFNFNGGTLRTTVSDTNFMNGLTNAVVKTGGAIIDTAGFNITIAQSLQDGGGGLRKIGNGVLTLSGFNAYTGPTTISAGTLSVPTISAGGSPSTLGASTSDAANLVFDGGTLRYSGLGETTDRNYTVNAGQNANFDVSQTGATLTMLGNAAPGTTGGLTKTGNGLLSLAGLATYTGNTTINGGVLAASGAYPGAFVVNNGGHLTAQNGLVGTLSVGTLTLNTGSALDFEFGAGNDVITIANPNGLTLGNTGLFLYQEASAPFPFTTNGTYTLLDYMTAFTGSLSSSFFIANSQVGKVYGLNNNTTNTTIELTIADAVTTSWNVDGGGAWELPGNWTAGVPNSIGAIATFGSVLTQPAATVTVASPKTVGTIVFDNFTGSYTISGGAGSTITLNNGFGVPSITVINGIHTVAAPLAVSQNSNIAVATDTTLTISGNISGAGGLTFTDLGTAILSGNNSYSGPTIINSGTITISGNNTLSGPILLKSGTLEIDGNGANGATGIVASAGSALRIGGGAVTLAQALSFDIATATPVAATGQVNGNGNFSLEVLTGSDLTVSGLFSAPSGSVVKRGGGSLTLTNPGATVLGSVPNGISFDLQEGNVFLNGGPNATYAVGGEFTIGDNTPNEVSVTLASGTLTVGTFVSIGRGNGTSGLASSLNITGGTLNTLNLYTGFGNGVGGFNARPAINISGSGIANATTTRIGESNGSVSTLALTGSATLNNTGAVQVGFDGAGIVTVADLVTVNVAELGLGYNNNSTGIVRQTAGIVQQAAGGGDWRIGGFNAGNGYGSYSITGGTLTTGRNLQIGANGAGVLDISGTGSVSTTGGFPVVGRFVGGSGVLNVSAGSFNQTTAGNLFIIGEAGTGVVNVSNTGQLNITGNPGGAGAGGGTGGIRLGHVAGGNGTLNVNGGTVTASGIAKSDFSGIANVYLNGGTVRANASNTTFLQGLDNVVVGPGGANFDTNGNNITVAQQLIAPSGDGVATIPILDGGSGYLAAPVVQIIGDGSGATALANLTNGVVTSITITNPGINYFNPPSVTLLGGGGTGATADLGTLAPTAGTGGLTKNGAGTLTLTSSNTYGGATTVNQGQLAFGASQTLGALNIGAGTTVTLLPDGAGALPGAAFDEGGDLGAGAPVQAVPEPGALSLLAVGVLSLLRRRRQA